MFCGSEPAIDIVEPDFSESGSRDWERKLTPDEQKATAYDPGHRYYHAYVHPKTNDPAVCDPDWPLAAYWPVYLSNFLVAEWVQLDGWYHQVSDFFASKGLLTRMMYFPVANDEPLEYARMMKRTSLIEGLVYFCSKRDAKEAIANCHRALYYGHRVNVLPGRRAEYFANKRSVRFIKNTDKKEREVESSLEKQLNPFGEVEFSTRHSAGNIIVQFKTSEGMLNALSNQIHWKPLLLKEQTQKQRFLEADMKRNILALTKLDPSFMDQKPRPEIMQFFTDGVFPVVDNSWKFFDSLQARLTLASRKVKTRLNRLRRRQIKLREKPDLQPPQPTTVKGPKKKTIREHQSDVLKSVNWFLRTNKKPVMSLKGARAMMRDQHVARRRAERLNP